MKPQQPQKTPAQQLEAMKARYSPHVVQLAEALLAWLRRRLPHGSELIYDNYNALVIGFGPTERASDAIFSVALYPRWVTLFFLQGARLPNPFGLLQGKGKCVRSVVFKSLERLDQPELHEMIDIALEHASVPMPSSGKRKLLIKAIAANQRPRRPSSAKLND